MKATVTLATVGVAAALLFGCTNRPLTPVFADPSGTAVEFFRQTENTAATILWVIDNSGSMCEEQFNVRNNVASFINALNTTAAGATYNMGVITSDTLNPNQSGRLVNAPSPAVMTALCPTPPPPLDCTTGLPNPLPKWVSDGDPMLLETFQCLSEVGISGFGGETSLGAMRMALSSTLLNDPSANGGFLIPDSLLAIIFVGDEDDCSVCSGATCGPLPNLQANLDCSINRVNELTPVADFVGAINPVADSIVVASIIGVDQNLYAANCSGGICSSPVSAGPVVADPGGEDALVPICSAAGLGSAAPAPRIEAFTRSFEDGREYAICDPNYGDELADIGNLIGALLNSGCLQQAPCPSCDLATCSPAEAFATCAGATPLADRVVVRITASGVTNELVPCVDYDIEADMSCAGGYRINFDPAGTGTVNIPGGANVEVIYGFDTGDGCAAGN